MKTMLVFVVDRSGSMYTQAGKITKGVNELIEKQNDGSHTVLRLVEFDSSSQVVYDNVRIENADKYHLKVGGTTRLNDTVIEEIENVRKYITKMGKSRRPELVLFHICTDGYDNVSEHHSNSVKEKIQEASKLGWEFVFIGEGRTSVTGNAFGVKETHSYSGNKAQGIFEATSNRITRMKSQALSGQPVDNSYTKEEIGMFS